MTTSRVFISTTVKTTSKSGGSSTTALPTTIATATRESASASPSTPTSTRTSSKAPCGDKAEKTGASNDRLATYLIIACLASVLGTIATVVAVLKGVPEIRKLYLKRSKSNVLCHRACSSSFQTSSMIVGNWRKYLACMLMPSIVHRSCALAGKQFALWEVVCLCFSGWNVCSCKLAKVKHRTLRRAVRINQRKLLLSSTGYWPYGLQISFSFSNSSLLCLTNHMAPSWPSDKSNYNYTGTQSVTTMSQYAVHTVQRHVQATVVKLVVLPTNIQTRFSSNRVNDLQFLTRILKFQRILLTKRFSSVFCSQYYNFRSESVKLKHIANRICAPFFSSRAWQQGKGIRKGWVKSRFFFFFEMTQILTVKEEIFGGEKFRTFPSKTFRMELNFVLSNWLKTGKQEKTIERPVNRAEEILVWKLISYIFELYESYEIKFPTKISSFTVLINQFSFPAK